MRNEEEKELPEDAPVEEEIVPELNVELLNQVIMMGIPELAAKWALYNTGNNSPDMAVTWYFDNMDNACLQQEFKIKKKQEGTGSGPQVPTEIIEQLKMMGFSNEKKILKALKECNNDPERAVEWLFSH